MPETDNPTKDLSLELAKAKRRIAELESSLAEASRLINGARQTRALFLTLVENLPFEVFALNELGRYFFQNTACRERWGDVTGKSPDETGAEGENIRLWTNNNLRAYGGETVMGEQSYDLDGKRIDYLQIITPIYSDNPASGIIGVNIDISRIKKIERNFTLTEAKFKAVFEQTGIGLLIFDDNGCITECNKAFSNIFGVRDNSLYIGLNLKERLPDGPIKQTVYDCLEHGQGVYAGQYTSLLTGRKIHISLISRRIGNDFNLTVLEDRTRLHLYESELIREKEAALASSRAKSEFLANMSHEIRTPLNGLMGMLQLLFLTSLSDEQKEYADTAIVSCKRLTALLEDILDLSRIEAGILLIRNEAFNLSDVLDSVNALFRPPAEQAGIAFSIKLHPKADVGLIGDSTRLRQVLFNLVGNAVKFTETGGLVLIEACLLPVRRNGYSMLLFVVSDTGIGIPDEKITLAFESFRQVDGSYTRKYQGVGLGLSIVKKIVGLMNGNICVESETGVGTTFYISLPLKISGRKDKRYSIQASRTSPLPIALKALTVEDDFVNRLALTKILKNLGIETDEARDGEEALAKLRSNDYDLVFMDIQLPLMDGVKITEIVRTSPEFKHKADIPIIAITAYAMEGDRENFLRAGMSDYLAKPVEMDRLLKVLERIFNQGHA